MSPVSSRSVAVGLLAASALLGFVATAQPATGLAVLALATVPALFAVPPGSRLWLGVVVTGISSAVALLGDLEGQAPAWAAVGGLVVAGVTITARGRWWPPLGARYDPATDGDRGDDPRHLWRALDRGEDPTGSDSPEPTEANRRSPEDPVD